MCSAAAVNKSRKKRHPVCGQKLFFSICDKNFAEKNRTHVLKPRKFFKNPAKVHRRKNDGNWLRNLLRTL